MGLDKTSNNIFFYWDGHIHPSRLDILKDCIYSTRVMNPSRPIYLVTNSLTSDIFDSKFNIQIYNWDISILLDTPFPKDKLKYYINPDSTIICNPRELSDLMRICLLFKFGGSYIDTDDLAIKPICDTLNLICRSYDPHTCHYNDITPEECIPGVHREIKGYDDINFFPRNDCWLNFEPNSPFIYSILSNEKLKTSEGAIYIGDNFSWQSLTLDACIEHISKIGNLYNVGLTLLYLYEDFVAASSYWDRCDYGGEMCDLWKEMEGVETTEWGFYRCNKSTAIEYFEKVKSTYPFLSHLWLHDKDMNKDWLLPELTEEHYQVSTWIYNEIKNEIKKYKK
jgi:hypothetical protein